MACFRALLRGALQVASLDGESIARVAGSGRRVKCEGHSLRRGTFYKTASRTVKKQC
jgi:hypothetical protein